MESELPGRRRETPRESRLREHAAGARPPGRRPGAGTVAARASRAGPCASRRARCRGRNRSRLHRPASAGPRAFLPLGFVRGGCYVGAFFFFFFFSLSLLIPPAQIGAHASRRRPAAALSGGSRDSSQTAKSKGTDARPERQGGGGKPSGHGARGRAQSIHTFYWLHSLRTVNVLLPPPRLQSRV